MLLMCNVNFMSTLNIISESDTPKMLLLKVHLNKTSFLIPAIDA